MAVARAFMFLLGLTFATSAESQRTAWPISTKHPGAFRVGVWNRYPQTASPTPGHTVHNLLVAFDNYSNQEVVSVDFEFTLLKEGKTIVKRGPFHADRFTDHYFMSRHGAVPGQRAFADIPLPFDLPVGAWEPSDGAEVKIVKFEVAKDPASLTDLGHFATWFKLAEDATVEQTVQRNPKLRELRNEDGYTSLAVALFFGDRRKLAAVAGDQKASEVRFARGYSAFHLAVRNWNEGILDELLKRGANPDARGDNGTTPLMVAINNYATNSVRWLLRHGVEIDTMDRSGWTALRYAIRSDDPQLIHLLVDSGARLTLHGPDGYGPMHYATGYGDSDAISILAAGGASVNDVDPAFGITPLMAAANYQNWSAVRWLVTHGARIDLQDRKGKTAFDYARDGSPDHSDARFRAVVDAAKH